MYDLSISGHCSYDKKQNKNLLAIVFTEILDYFIAEKKNLTNSWELSHFIAIQLINVLNTLSIEKY
jgi:hypothetical protein